MIDEIRSSTLMGYGFKLVRGDQAASEQGPRTPFPPVPGSSSCEPSVDALLLDQSLLKTKLAEVKAALAEEKVLNAKRHEHLMSILSTLSAKLSSPPPWNSLPPDPFPVLSSFIFWPILNNCFSLSGCALWLTMVCANLGRICCNAVTCLSSCCYVFLNDWDGQYHYRTIYLSVSLVVFPPLPKWWWLQTPCFSYLTCPPFFDDVKREKMGMTMIVLVWPSLSWLLKNFLFYSLTVWHSLAFVSHLLCQYGHLVCHHQKGGNCWPYPYVM